MPPRLLALNVLENELEAGAAFCRREGLGIEVTTFASTEALDAPDDDLIRRHAALLDGLRISVHGPFIDLFVASADPAIVEVCRRRHGVALRAAVDLEAAQYVAHLNSVPLISNIGYRQRFPRAAADFWLPFADLAGNRDMTIVLENMWESGPELQAEVVERAAHPHLKASFDNGHALVFSDVPARRWIETLGENLHHCHLHDNDGEYDHHWSAGDGIENWPEFLRAVESHSPHAALVMESDGQEANRKSLDLVRRLLARAAPT